MKPAGSLVRYMTLHNRRRDFIESLLEDISRLKVKRIVKMTEKRCKDTQELLRVHRKALAEVKYAQLCLRNADLRKLPDSAPALAVMSSSSAVALAAASTEKERAKVQAALLAIEKQQGLGPFERGRWKDDYPPYVEALGRLKQQEIQRRRDRIEVLVLEVRQLHSDRTAAGCADKDTKRLQSASKRKHSQVWSLLEEMYGT
ncbi:hypothetical protein HYH03_000813 [Edaphochlamys debaryana]|uniref:Uncharacterized protein n=1 Tax=Edaphochlamys debaryana TaxID=47281 RepID=A0A835YHD3_9CHLO|nr:hypothetical protein HYH03_000813 [Edaphochlamys debaryana]|eukprot:KAG2500991.1 hypothetical protein HYH03_000813 [Edaphochlamys debaryana]